jgi:hypothetical protein
MKFISLSYQQWEKYRRPILDFVKRYDKSTEQQTYKKLFKMKKHHLHEPGTCIKIALWEGKVIALAALTNYGTTFSTLLISPKYIHTQIQANLISSLKDELGVCYQKIRYDDETMIKTVIQAGLVCFAYTNDCNGHTHLWFGGGHWHSNDISEKEA